MDLRFVKGLGHIRGHAVDKRLVLRVIERRERPHTNERLIQQVLLIPVGRELAVHFDHVLLVQLFPAGHASVPFQRHLGQHIDPGADVFTSLGIVRRGCRQRVRPPLMALPHGVMKD